MKIIFEFSEGEYDLSQVIQKFYPAVETFVAAYHKRVEQLERSEKMKNKPAKTKRSGNGSRIKRGRKFSKKKWKENRGLTKVGSK